MATVIIKHNESGCEFLCWDEFSVHLAGFKITTSTEAQTIPRAIFLKPGDKLTIEIVE